MLWLTLVITFILAVAVGAVLSRHPGIVLYDWLATRQVNRKAAAQERRRLAQLPTHAHTHPAPAPSVG
ncbi:MAG TPA: hypothetical protein DIW53_17350 [Achromobacter sp.]|uniref:hypothetical protein n=1 Tax=Achromobacter sp. B7 TaxID=2282475 RepID=UPI000E72CF32|nr:hypothetical protein [Achromobacter sp. B7]AYD64189.1 hypothetical protein DVB37_09860 [Achromobacter sp. B7]HCQ48418.1 hypothetical protein [Achromobacter sp.]